MIGKLPFHRWTWDCEICWYLIALFMYSSRKYEGRGLTRGILTIIIRIRALSSDIKTLLYFTDRTGKNHAICLILADDGYILNFYPYSVVTMLTFTYCKLIFKSSSMYRSKNSKLAKALPLIITYILMYILWFFYQKTYFKYFIPRRYH